MYPINQVKPYREGSKTFKGDAVYYNFHLFKPNFTDEEILENFQESHGYPGEYFASKPSLIRGKYRVLVTQRCGLDV